MVQIGLVLSELMVLVVSLAPLGIVLHYLRRAVRTMPPLIRDTPDASHLQQRAIRQARTARVAAGVSLLGVAASLVLGKTLVSAPSNWLVFVPALAMTVLGIIITQSASPSAYRSVHSPQLDPEPRNIWSFGSTWWFVIWMTTASILALTIAVAGAASSQDEHGNYSLLTLQVGEMTVSTVFLGWFYGIPVLACVAGLMAATYISLWRGMRPAMAAGPDHRRLDTWTRRLHTGIVLLLGTGALVFTLGMVLSFIARSAQLASEVPVESAGEVSVTTSFSALSWPFAVFGVTAQAVGIAMIVGTLFIVTPRLAGQGSREAHSNPVPGKS